MIDLTVSPGLRRAAALGILGTLLMSVASLFGGPIGSYLDRQAIAAAEADHVQQFRDRIESFRQIGRRGTVIRAPGREAAISAATGVVMQAVPQASFQLIRATPLPPRSDAPALVDLGIDARATSSGLRDFLAALEKSGLAIMVPTIDIRPAAPVQGDGPPTPIVLDVHLVMTGAFVGAVTK